MIDDSFNIVLPPVRFMASFDPVTYKILSVGPAVAFEDEPYKLPIDSEVALSIIEGKISISRCFVNNDNNCVEISEITSVVKIDDLLHRVPTTEFSNIEDPDMFITVDADKFVFELSTALGGTKINIKANGRKLRKMIWSGQTDLCFYITDYNDPNVLYQKIEFSLQDLIEKTVVVPKNKTVPKDISVYTRRLFKNYIVEMK